MTTERIENLKYLRERIKEVEARKNDLEIVIKNESAVRRKLFLQSTWKANRDILALLNQRYLEVEAGL